MNFYVSIGVDNEKLIGSYAADDDQARRLIKECMVAEEQTSLLKSWAAAGYCVRLVERL